MQTGQIGTNSGAGNFETPGHLGMYITPSPSGGTVGNWGGSGYGSVIHSSGLGLSDTAGKRLELLKQIAPNVTRVSVLRDPTNPGSSAEFAAIQALAQSLGVEVRPINSHQDAAQIERVIATFESSPNGGVILTPTAAATLRRETIIQMMSQNKLPAVYPFRYQVSAGGLASIGPDVVAQCRLAAAYVDRVLKGEKPGDLPVQAQTKYEIFINLKTAKALGLSLSADEVIE